MNEAATPLISLTEKDKARFWAKVDKSGGPDACWIWTAAKDAHGYGNFGAGGHYLKAHRVAWTLANGQIPHDGSAHGICVCHNCPGGDRRDCVNPAHLFQGTQYQNMLDRGAKGRQAKGEAQGISKLTAEKVVEIRVLYAAGGNTMKSIAAKFGVNGSVVCEIINRKAWQHV